MLEFIQLQYEPL